MLTAHALLMPSMMELIQPSPSARASRSFIALEEIVDCRVLALRGWNSWDACFDFANNCVVIIALPVYTSLIPHVTFRKSERLQKVKSTIDPAPALLNVYYELTFRRAMSREANAPKRALLCPRVVVAGDYDILCVPGVRNYLIEDFRLLCKS